MVTTVCLIILRCLPSGGLSYALYWITHSVTFILRLIDQEIWGSYGIRITVGLQSEQSD